MNEAAVQRVLVADDEPLLLEGLAWNLIGLNLVVTARCTNGREAIDACGADRPDIAIIDVQMPVLSGLEAAKIISSEMNVPVVMISEFSDPKYLKTCTDLGVLAYLLKPASREYLRAALAITWSIHLRFQEMRRENVRLEQRLRDRQTIERAKWILVDRLKMTEDAAMKRLQYEARYTRRTLSDIARSIIENNNLFDRFTLLPDNHVDALESDVELHHDGRMAADE